MNQANLAILVVIVWDLIWKAIALWRSARLGHKYFFVILLIVNSVGIVPIVYLLYLKYYYNRKVTPAVIAPKRKRLKKIN